MNLVVGATGMLGGEICRLLAAERKSVRALVRRTSAPDKVSTLDALGAEIVYGDLKDPESLAMACRGSHAVISTASSVRSRQSGDSIETVDEQGQLHLIDVAERAGVAHFVLISFPEIDVDFPLQSAKRAIEDRLRRGSMTYTILQPTVFMEVWLSPALGFDAVTGTAQIYGAGQNRISWISFQDVAKFAVAALDNARANNATIKLGGPEALSPLEVVHLVEQTSGRKMTVQHVPEEALRGQYASAADALQKSFAALMLSYAAGGVIEMTETLRGFPHQQLKSVREHFKTLLDARPA
jgi:NADH dehydrogenase